MQKNRIYLRKKGDDKNRKNKDFFPPVRNDKSKEQGKYRIRKVKNKENKEYGK